MLAGAERALITLADVAYRAVGAAEHLTKELRRINDHYDKYVEEQAKIPRPLCFGKAEEGEPCYLCPHEMHCLEAKPNPPTRPENYTGI